MDVGQKRWLSKAGASELLDTRGEGPQTHLPSQRQIVTKGIQNHNLPDATVFLAL